MYMQQNYPTSAINNLLPSLSKMQQRAVISYLKTGGSQGLPPSKKSATDLAQTLNFYIFLNKLPTKKAIAYLNQHAITSAYELAKLGTIFGTQIETSFGGLGTQGRFQYAPAFAFNYLNIVDGLKHSNKQTCKMIDVLETILFP